jgi:hypothetical protein
MLIVKVTCHVPAQSDTAPELRAQVQAGGVTMSSVLGSAQLATSLGGEIPGAET